LFGSLGAPEVIAILVLALLLFGPKKLPELGRTLGKSIAEFRRATHELKVTLEREMAEAEHSQGASEVGGTVSGTENEPSPAEGEQRGRDPV